MLTPQQEAQFVGVFKAWLSNNETQDARISLLKSKLDPKVLAIFFTEMLDDILTFQADALAKAEAEKAKMLAGQAEITALKASIDTK